MPTPFSDRLLTFLRADSGAVTVDWVVLTAAITGLGLATVSAVRTGTSGLGGEIETSLSGASVASLGMLGDDNYDGPLAIGTVQSLVEVATACPRGSGACFETVITTTTHEMADGSQWTSVTYEDQLPDAEPSVIWYDQDGAVVDAPRINQG